MSEIGIPSWINRNYIGKVLHAYDNTLKLLNFDLETPSSTNGFTSFCIVAYINYENEDCQKGSLKVVIKPEYQKDTCPERIVMNWSVFQTEIAVYTTVLPKIKKLLQKFGKQKDFYPRLIYHSDYPVFNIVLEFIDNEQYKCTWDKAETLEEAKLMFKFLADFHAASYYLAEEEGSDFSSFKNCLFHCSKNADMLYTDSLRVLRSCLNDWEGGDKYIDGIENLANNCLEIGLKCYTANAREEGYNVLCHGDYHVANMLRSFDHLYLIDYQLAVWCSPAIDFYYALYQVSLENQQKYKDLLAEFYHNEFSNQLKKLKFSKAIPTLHDFKTELRKNAALRTMMLTCFLPYAFRENLDSVTFDNLHDMELKKKLYENEECKQVLAREMDYLVKENLF